MAMTKYELILDYIKQFRDLGAENCFSNGMCYHFTVLLRQRFGPLYCPIMYDEVENHFHKTLVENMISLFKDKTVNKKSATLVFTTHYCEVLDLFNRQDNIWIAKSDNKIRLDNMYETYNIRAELLKSRQFYNNAFDTSVNYEDLMALKRELMR